MRIHRGIRPRAEIIMLKNTFHHIPGIGVTKERRLWDAGILSWEDFLNHDAPFMIINKRSSIKKKRAELIAAVKESINRLEERNLQYFAQRLPSSQWWILFKDFRDRIAYLDIATTRLYGILTTIALYDGKRIKTYVRGKNLYRFKNDIQKYDVLVTYNGKSFDVPIIESYFGITLRQLHIDLRYLLKSLGFSHGLKGCERAVGIDRNDLAGLEDHHAIFLWKEYKSGEEKALETLLAYNCQNTVSLETLMVMAYNLKLKDTPFLETHRLPLPTIPGLTPKADLATVDRVKDRDDWSWHDYFGIRGKTDLATVERVKKRGLVAP